MNSKIVVLALFAILLGCAMASHGHNHNTPAPTQASSHTTRHSSTTGTATQAPTPAPTPAPTQSSHTTRHSSTTGNTTPAPTHVPSASPTTKPSSTSGSSSGSNGDLCAVTATSSEPVKLLVPLYVYPGKDWDTVANAAKTGVKIIAIINPNSGPESSGPDSSYTSYMNKLTQAGVDMVGYVHTSYGARSASDVNADVDVYAAKYPGLKGIFLDEASPSASELSYYSTVYNHIKAKSGYVNTILNPGTQPDQGYLDVSTNIVIFEDAGSNLKNNYASWVKCAPSSSEKSGYKYKFSGIAHSTNSGSMSSIVNTMVNSGMGLVYVTDGAAGCCTYNALTSYLSSEASVVAALN